MYKRLYALATTAGIGGYSAYILHQHNWDVRNIGLIRFGRAASAVASISIDYKSSVSKLKDDSEEALVAWSNCHRRSAEKLLDLCCKNGGVFIKVGQHIAALDYLVPREYVEVLGVLHNRGPRSNIDDIKRVILEECGRPFDEVFTDFEMEPLGAASLAQVHKARLAETGQIVAVKVQHPNVRKHSLIDMATMDILFHAVSQVFPDFNFEWLANETRRNLPYELDFVNEGRNAETMAAILRNFPWLKIPRIYWPLTSTRLLVMEYKSGEVISNRDYMVKNKIDLVEICSRIEKIYSEMIFKSGTVHCDPHPGNILINKTPGGPKSFEVVLLDHGLFAHLTDDFRETYTTMMHSVLSGNEEEIIRCAKKMGIESTNHYAQLLSCMISAKPWSAVKRGLANIPDEETASKEKDELRKNAAAYFNDISKILATVDRQLLLIMKTNDLIRSIAYTLGSDERQSFLTMTRACYTSFQNRRWRHSNWLERFVIHLQTRWFYFKMALLSFYYSITYSPKSPKKAIQAA